MCLYLDKETTKEYRKRTKAIRAWKVVELRIYQGNSWHGPFNNFRKGYKVGRNAAVRENPDILASSRRNGRVDGGAIHAYLRRSDARDGANWIPTYRRVVAVTILPRDVVGVDWCRTEIAARAVTIRRLPKVPKV